MSRMDGRHVIFAGLAVVLIVAAGVRVWLGGAAGASVPLVAIVDGPGAPEVTRPLPPTEPAARQLVDMMLAQTFHMLPAEHRTAIIRADQRTTEFIRHATEAQPFAAVCPDPTEPEEVLLAKISPVYRRMFLGIREARSAGVMLPSPCFAEGTPDEVIRAFSVLDEGLGRAQLDNRWSFTATDGGGLQQGQPTTLTYSFVPDGTFIGSFSTGPAGNSNLIAFLDGIYGDSATWQALFAQVFARWSELSGLSYVFEPNDDGGDLGGDGGFLGVRGDVRISGRTIDGSGLILAFNFYPNNGDMVIDTSDTFFNATFNGSLRLRQVVAHEHGHGLGLRHVCPVTQTKLMEPFISNTPPFDGPQHDDVRGVQRHYGDKFEDADDSSGTAADAGDLTIGTTLTLESVPFPVLANSSILSIDDNGESDWFRFTTPGALELSVTVTPRGFSYDDSPQLGNGNCASGNIIDSSAIQNLQLEIRGLGAASILATASANPAGSAETVSGLQLDEAGEYFIRVSESAFSQQAQLYELEISAAAPPFAPLTVTASGVPTAFAPGTPVDFSVEIDPGGETVTPGSQLLHYRYDGGTFQTVALISAGGNTWTATLPAALCGDAAEFFVSAVGDTSVQVQDPIRGALKPFIAPVTTTTEPGFSDNFETDLGWTRTGGARDGHWERGTPNGLGNGEPSSDFDGSSQCFITRIDNFSPFTDVDFGLTRLTSPPIDISDGGVLSYAYWLHDNVGGTLTEGDGLTVEVATNAAGTDWMLLRSYTTAQAAWQTDSILIGSEVPASPTVRVRFTASDLGAESKIEAGIDAVAVQSNLCFAADGDFDMDGDVDLADYRGFQSCFGLAVAGACDNVDMNGDNVVDGADFVIWESFLDASGPL